MDQQVNFTNVVGRVPDHLKEWTSGLTETDIASILTVVGSASNSISKRDLTDNSQYFDGSSACIGIQGEGEVQTILQERFKSMNTAKSGKCGDFIVTSTEGVRILVEVKKYSKTVPSIEVEKFYRDIDANGSIRGGVMISLTSHVVGVNKALDHSYQVVNGGRVPIVFLSLQNVASASVAKECVYAAIDIVLAGVASSDTFVDVGGGIAATVDDIDKNLDYLSQSRLVIHETQAMFNKQLGKLLQQVIAAEINIKNSIRVLRLSVAVAVVAPVDSAVTGREVVAAFGLEPTRARLLEMVIDAMRGVRVVKDVVAAVSGRASVKVAKTVMRVTVALEMGKLIPMCEPWSYDGECLTVVLTERTLHPIVKMVEAVGT